VAAQPAPAVAEAPRKTWRPEFAFDLAWTPLTGAIKTSLFGGGVTAHLILLDRFVGTLRYGVFAELTRDGVGEDLPDGTGLLHRTIGRTSIELAAGYRLPFVHRRHSMYLDVDAGVAGWDEETHETRLELQLVDPSCDISAGPCEVTTSATRTDVERSFGTPLLEVGYGDGLFRLSFSAFPDLRSRGRSAVRFMMSWRLP
jgi:hypothetical protein